MISLKKLENKAKSFISGIPLKKVGTVVIFSLIGGYLLFFCTQAMGGKIAAALTEEKPAPPPNIPEQVKNIKYGFVLDDYHYIENQIQSNQTLADILLPYQVSYQTIDQLAKSSVEVFDVRKIRPGKNFMILAKDSTSTPSHFIYEPDVYSYIVYELGDSVKIYKEERPIEKRIREVSGTITSSLWEAITGQGLSFSLAGKMEDAFAWSVDFYHIQKNDGFKLIFEENYIDGKAAGIGKLHAALFKHADKDYYAFHYENDKYEGFYDENGRPMKKAFLKSPVKYSRISSRYNPRRFHPILKRVRPHLGTDYAAPYGTPIRAVANGVVTKANYTKGNGRFVKIKHDAVYETQYLHMQKFAKGMRPGVQVKQGEVIGYVGSTGLATGPHVCFRFWKNGRQVDPLRENLPPPEPMAESELPLYKIHSDSLKSNLDKIEFPVVTLASSTNEPTEEGPSNP